MTTMTCMRMMKAMAVQKPSMKRTDMMAKGTVRHIHNRLFWLTMLPMMNDSTQACRGMGRRE